MQAEQTFEIGKLVNEQKIGRFAVSLLIWCFLVLLVDGYDQVAIAYAAPGIVKDWSLTRGSFGPIFGSGLFGAMIGSFVFGYLGDRFGRRSTIIGGIVLFGVLTLASAWVVSVKQLMILRFCAGLGMGGVFPNLLALVSEYAPKRLRVTWGTIAVSGFSVGAATSGFMSAGLLSLHYGWAALFVVGGGGALVIAVLITFALPESAEFLVIRKSDPLRVARLISALRPEIEIKSNAKFTISEKHTTDRFSVKLLFTKEFRFITLWLWIEAISVMVVLYFLQNWLPILIGGLGISAQRAGMTTAMFPIGGIVGGLIAGRCVDRYGVIAMSLFALVGCPLVVALGFPMSELMLGIVVFAAGVCSIGMGTALYGVGGLVYPTSFRSVGIGSMIAFGKIGSVAGPVLGGFLVAMNIPTLRLLQVVAVPLALAALSSVALGVLYRSRSGRVNDVSQNRSEDNGIQNIPIRRDH
jgi:AAHS family 4-hydroxybenzoate transporter-like MFS transporter